MNFYFQFEDAIKKAISYKLHAPGLLVNPTIIVYTSIIQLCEKTNKAVIYLFFHIWLEKFFNY